PRERHLPRPGFLLYAVKSLLEGGVDQHLLLELARRVAPRGRARALRARHQRQWEARADVLEEARPDAVPRAHVLRLLLHPDERRAVLERLERRRQLLVERVELLQTHDGHVLAPELLPLLGEVVIDLAAAQEDPLHLGRAHAVVADDALELAVREIVE